MPTNTQPCQRWRNKRDSYRPAGELIQPDRYNVAELRGDAVAKAFVTHHHYSATYPSARFRFGMFEGEKLVGVAVFSHPVSNKVLTNVFGGDALESAELGRFVLLDEVPSNGETWFLAKCRRALKSQGLRGIVSFSDPVARETEDGEQVFPGHIGTIYQASNAAYLGRATGRTLHLLPSGRVFSARAQSKIRNNERGSHYAVEQLVAAGAPVTTQPDAEWLDTAMERVTRKLRHPGNHRYAWVLNGPKLTQLSQRYPKFSTRGNSDLFDFMAAQRGTIS